MGFGNQETFLCGSMVWGEFRAKTDDSSFIIINCYYTGIGSFDAVADRINAIVADKDMPFVVAIHNAASSSLGANALIDAECVINRMSEYGYAVYTSSGFSLDSNPSDVSSAPYRAYYEEIELKKIK